MRNKTLTFFLFVGLFVLASFSAKAQSTATVYGKLTDTDNEPIEGVTISILGSPQAPELSDAGGNYSYSIPADKEVTIVFTSINHKPTQKTVKLAANQKTELNQSMIFKNTLIEVEVTDNNRFHPEQLLYKDQLLNF